MRVPKEFQDLCLAFHQDCFIIFDNVEHVINDFLLDLTDSQKNTLAQFLAKSIKELSPFELMELWNSQDTDTIIRSPAGASAFWRDIAKAVAAAAGEV